MTTDAIGKIRVNTLDGKALPKKHRFTVTGPFVSKTKAKGTYRIHVGNCKKTKFTAVLDQSSSARRVLVEPRLADGNGEGGIRTRDGA